MKNYLLVLVCIAICFSSCSTKFKVGADYKEVTIVYGLLATSDTAHYIKILKGYYDENLNNLSLAQNADSIYFNNLEVKMQIVNNGNVVSTISLLRVDLNMEGYPKDPGVFANTPNYAYKFTNNLDPSKIYRLKVKNLSTGKEIEGETPIINSSLSVLNFTNFTQADELYLSDPKTPFNFIWKGPSTASFYDVVLRIGYQEVDINTLDTVYKSKEVAIVKNQLGNIGEINAYVSSDDFFKQLNSEIGAAGNVKRYLDTPDLVLLAGGEVLKTYIDVNSAQGGITGDQLKPNYTNLKGENVLGILSTRGRTELHNMKFSAATIDSIINGSYTKGLKFVGISKK